MPVFFLFSRVAKGKEQVRGTVELLGVFRIRGIFSDSEFSSLHIKIIPSTLVPIRVLSNEP